MSRVRAVLFDLFDTVVDLHFSRLPMREVGERRTHSTLLFQHQAIAARGHTVDLDIFLDTLRESDRELYRSHIDQGLELPTVLRFQRAVERLGLDDEELPAILTRTHMGKIKEVAETPAHHEEILRELAVRHRVGLCSNFSDAETAIAILDEAGLRPHFASLAISETVGIRKPRPEIFRHALEGLGVTPDEAVHVGDNLDADVRGATEVGMRTIWVHRRVRDKDAALDAYDGPPPTWIVDDLSAIPSLL